MQPTKIRVTIAALIPHIYTPKVYPMIDITPTRTETLRISFPLPCAPKKR